MHGMTPLMIEYLLAAIGTVGQNPFCTKSRRGVRCPRNVTRGGPSL
jgi:hypothetical protein